MQALIFGADHPAAARLRTFQTPGGSGGLRVAEDYVKAMALGADAVAVSNSAMQAVGYSDFERRKFLTYLRQLHGRAGMVNWELQIFHILAKRILDEIAEQVDALAARLVSSPVAGA